MSAMAGASGVRAWLQSRGWSFVTPERLRRTTIGLFVAATLVSTIGLSGSTKTTPPEVQGGHATVVAQR